MLNFLRLIRLPNLLMIALAQFLVRYCIILPAYRVSYAVTGEFPVHLSSLYFSILCTSTLLIAAAGYIVNDVFDQGTDEFNKPGKNLINRVLKESVAMKMAYGFFGIGIILGFIVSFQIGKPLMGMVQVFSAFSLYMYSSFYQKRILSGNLLIAFLSALSLLVVGLYEPNFYPNFMYLIWYVLFAFLVSLMRELIKDIEDVDGDERTQYITFPVRYGIRASKRLLYVYSFITIGLIAFILYTFFYDNNVINFWYLLAMFLIPFLALMFMIKNAEEKKDFSYASMFTKAIMLTGLLSMIGFWYYFLR